MIDDDELQIVVIENSRSADDLEIAHVPGGYLDWLRQPSETRTEFRHRAIVSARAAGARSIVFEWLS
jgi:hypothetical protein